MGVLAEKAEYDDESNLVDFRAANVVVGFARIDGGKQVYPERK